MINDNTAGMTPKQRVQTNFDERLLMEISRHPESTSFLECLAPSRSPQKCERYTVSELTSVHGDTDGYQVLIGETSAISDVKSQLRQLKQTRDGLREKYLNDLRAEWKRLLAKYPKKIVYWEKTSTMAFRKAKWVKLPTGQYRVVVKKVPLKPRPVHVVRRGVDFGIMWLTPRVRRELIVPIYQKLVVRPAGLRRVNIRKKVEKDGFDWSRIKPSYVVYKVNRRAQLDNDLAPIEKRIKDLYRLAHRRMQSPHKLIAYSSLGWIPPSWEEYYYQHFRRLGQYEEVYGHATPLEFRIGLVSTAGGIYVSSLDTGLSFFLLGPQFMGYGALCTQNLDELKSKVSDLGHDIPFAAPDSFLAKDMLYPRTVVDRLVMLGSKVNPDERDEQGEALAASTVRSLRNGSDYVFNLPRSIGELKDSKETFTQAYDFLRWLGRGTRSRQALPKTAKAAAERVLASTGSASLAVVGAFLAWKFAIQPTIQDCVTFREHSKEWLLATRRRLVESIAILKKTSSNILHIRAKFRGDDAERRKSLKNIVEDVEARREIVEITSWARFEPPVFVEVHDELNLQGSAEFSSENEAVDGFDPQYEVADQPVLGFSRYTSGEWRYTLTGAYPSRSVHGTVSSSDPALKPASFESEEVAVALDAAPLTDLVGTVLKSNLRDKQTEILGKTEWPRVNTAGYVKNQVEGVVFARYQLRDLLEFLDYDNQNNSLETLVGLFDQLRDWDGLLESCYHAALKDDPNQQRILGRKTSKVLASFDTVYVAWQLTPLSFVYDWITTSDSIVTRLNNFLTEYSVPVPPSLDGVWVTKRVELLTGRSRLELDPKDRMCSSYVSDWYGGKLTCTCTGLLAGHQSASTYTDYRYWAYPKRVVTTHQMRYVSDSKVSLTRSGLYAAKRGEYLDGGWETFLPQVRIKLNANKVGTLLGILAGFLKPRR